MVFMFQVSATAGSSHKKHATKADELQRCVYNAALVAQNIDTKIKNGGTLGVSVYEIDKSNVLILGVFGGAGKKNMLTSKFNSDGQGIAPFEYGLAPSVSVNLGFSQMWMIMPTQLYQTFRINFSPKAFRVGEGSAFTGGTAKDKMPDGTMQAELSLGIGKLFNLSNKFMLNALVEGKFMHSEMLVSDEWMKQGGINSFGAVLKTSLNYKPSASVSPYIKADFAFLSKKDYVGGSGEDGKAPYLPVFVENKFTGQLDIPKEKVFPSSVGAGVTLNFKETSKRLSGMNSKSVKIPKVQVNLGVEMPLKKDQYKNLAGYIAVGYNF
ncbi:MAG: hypothetical protein NT051_00770 [Candidatus Micrarchaeota archaeon]|nr:hypothetical protein [Candidatus Micrarchaeota archaeon]